MCVVVHIEELLSSNRRNQKPGDSNSEAISFLSREDVKDD